MLCTQGMSPTVGESLHFLWCNFINLLTAISYYLTIEMLS